MTSEVVEPSRERRGHAVLDLKSRDLKAMKIARLLGLNAEDTPKRMLEVGTGSGGIAHYFGTAGKMGWDVEAIDVEDVRLVVDGFHFTKVVDVGLPFPDDSFDVVLSNHVIEHVGDADQQARHLTELARVLRSDGIGYLAVPSRWMMIEPHYRLPFLSWLPRNLRSAYVRLSGKGRFYDCEPLVIRQVERLIAAAGLEGQNVCVEALRLTMHLEGINGVQARLANAVSDGTLRRLLPVFPTLCYTFRLAAGASR